MGTPFISFGNGELAKLDDMHIGDWIECPHCDDRHRINSFHSWREARRHLPPGVKPETLTETYYMCEGNRHLAGVNNKNVACLDVIKKH